MHLCRRGGGVDFGALPHIRSGVIMTYREIYKLDKHSIPAGREAEYAALIKKYIMHKSKLTRAVTIAFSACFVALMLFVTIARVAEIIADYPAVFWAVTAVLAAASAALLVAVIVNMVTFKKFLKKFE